MNSISNSLSGIQAAFRRQEVSAHNVANINSEGYKSRSLQQVESKAGGTEIAGQTISDKIGSPTGSNVDLAGELVGQMQNKHAVELNVAALKTSNEMLGELLDLTG